MSSSEAMPRTANLLACKHWWKVCFLYGDQEKYYRHVYGKAIAQRFAPEHAKLYSDQASEATLSKQPPPLYEQEETIKSKVTVLDDPFLLGLHSDSGTETSNPHLNKCFPEVLTNMNRNRRSGITDESGTVELAMQELNNINVTSKPINSRNHDNK